MSSYVTKNRLQTADEAIHGWYRFVLGYPPHLVSEYLSTLDAIPERDWVFDPFCGTATTPVEARLRGFSTISIDANPISILAAQVKLSWDIPISTVRSLVDDVMDLATASLQRYDLAPVPEGNYQLSFFGPQMTKQRLARDGLALGFNPDSLIPSKAATLIPRGFISRKPLLRTLALRYAINNIVQQKSLHDFMQLALATTIVNTAGNIGFGPEVYRLPPRNDADVLGAFANTVTRMVSDLQKIQANNPKPFPPAEVFRPYFCANTGGFYSITQTEGISNR